MTKRTLKGLAVTAMLGAVLAITGGCGTLIPKSVEFFQKKVTSVPVKTARQEETERQAAYAASLSARLTVEAAVSNNSPLAVVNPAKNTEALAAAVSTSLGPPQSVPSGPVTNLVNKVIENRADLNRSIEKYAGRVAPLVGKKIEGTGFIRIPYFVYIGGILLIVFLAWTALKIYGSMNPIVGLGTNVVGRLSSKAVAGIASQVTKGGEVFKEEVANSEFTSDVKAKVLELFQHAHEKTQDQSTQEVVKALTVKPSQV